jgi:stearoyl-CoA desaturase (delta-9 desaturase)
MLVYLLVVTQLTIFTVTLYLHRSQTIVAWISIRVLAHFFRFWGWLTTGMVTREWVAVHRKHHAKVETEEDPHSPMIYGIKKVFWDGVSLYRDACEVQGRHGAVWPRHAGRLGRAQRLWRPSVLGPDPDAADHLALFGVIGAAIWAVQMVWIPFWAAGFVNGIGHWWGYRNFESADTATQPDPVGLLDRRRRAAQQPPCFPQLGQVRAAQVGVRHRLGGHLRLRASVWPRCCAWRRRWTCVPTCRCRMPKR